MEDVGRYYVCNCASTGDRCRLSIPTALSGHYFIGSRPTQLRKAPENIKLAE